MTVTWTLGMLSAGVENVVPLADGAESSRAAAIATATGALVDAARDRGRAEYRLTVAGTAVIVIPGLTEHGDVDLVDLGSSLDDVLGNRNRPVLEVPGLG